MLKNTKILMLIENCPVYADNRVWAEASALRDAGYQVCVIGPKGTKDEQETYICLEGIHIYRYRLPAYTNNYIFEYGISLLATFLLSFKVWFRHGFDVIHTANPPDIFFVIGLFYRMFGKKFVFDQHDLAPEMFQVKFGGRMKLLHRLLLLVEWASYQTAHVVLTTNLSQKKFAIARGHCAADKVFVVRNGTDLNRIKLVPPEPELKRGRQYLLAYVGEMEFQDGVDNALYALHELVSRRNRRDIALVLMGDGGHMGTLRALTQTLQLDDYVSFTGWVTPKDINRYLTVADIGLTPDPANGLNEYCTMVKTLEYMAMGKPVVSFDLAEIRFSAGNAALYATPNLIEDFANKIEMLLDDEALRLKMGAIGRKRIEEAFSWEYDKQNLLLAYEKLKTNTNGRPQGSHPTIPRV